MDQSTDRPSPASVLYGNPGGSPGEHGNITAPLDNALRPLEGAARSDRNHTLAAQIKGTKATLAENMLSLGFSDGSAKEVAALITEYHNNPRDDAQMAKNLDEALEKLSSEWGNNFPANLDGAKKVLASLTKGNPALAEFLHSTGMSRDVRLLRLAGNIAKHRKI